MYIGLYEVRIFSVSENEENGLGDEGADGAMPPSRIFGLEPPLFDTVPACDGRTDGQPTNIWTVANKELRIASYADAL